MKFMGRVLLAAVFAASVAKGSSAQGMLDKLKQKAKDKVNSTGTTTPSATTTTAPASANASAATTPAPTATAMHAYTSYDFVPGDKTIVADNFSNTPDGDFPDGWKLLKGQAVVNHQAGSPALLLTAGDYGTFTRVTPRLKGDDYLGNAFTLEFDTYGIVDGGGPRILFTPDGDKPQIEFDDHQVRYNSAANENLDGRYPADISERAWTGRWHHIAIIYKQPQLKVYIDQYRVLYVPDTGNGFKQLYLAGIGKPDLPTVYRNVRLASGGGMNMPGGKFTGDRIISHGLYFDTDSATLRPESMGTLNGIKKLMDSDATLKFQIDGHTDSSGDAEKNRQLSEQRAEAVKAQLVSMGVDASRLTAKGMGATKPLNANDTPSNMANNRRVEFVRQM